MDAGPEAGHAGRDEHGDPGEGRGGHLRRLDEIATAGGTQVICDMFRNQVKPEMKGKGSDKLKANNVIDNFTSCLNILPLHICNLFT